MVGSDGPLKPVGPVPADRPGLGETPDSTGSPTPGDAPDTGDADPTVWFMILSAALLALCLVWRYGRRGFENR